MDSHNPFGAAEFKSTYGRKYHFQPNFRGWNKKAIMRVGFSTSLYGAAAGVAVLLFVSGIPRVQTDVLQKFPVVGRFFIREKVDPADNPF